MKKILWISELFILLLISMATLADTAVQGVRAGLQGGYGILDTKFRIKRVDQPIASDSSDISGRGVLGGFTLEWGNIIGNTDLYLGLEGSINFSTTKGKKSTLGTFPAAGPDEDMTTSVFFRRSIDVVGKIGYMLRNVALPYFKFGPTSGHWKASSVSIAAAASGASSINSMGFLAGLGVDFPMSERFSMGLAYDYRYYKNFNHNLNDTASGVPIRVVTVSPTAHAVMLRLTYKISATDFSTSEPQKERKRKRVKKPRPQE